MFARYSFLYEQTGSNRLLKGIVMDRDTNLRGASKMKPGSGVTSCPVCGNPGARFYANKKAVMIECAWCHAVVTKPNNLENENERKANV